jgi:CHASE2 domain-containing sensor protein
MSWLTRFTIPFLAAVIICGLLDSNLQDGWGFSSLEFHAYQTRAKWRRELNPVGKSGQPIVIVALSDATFSDPQFAHLHGPPVPRNYHARILRTLTEAGAKTIVFDLLFDIPRAEDTELAAAAKQSRHVTWACALDDTERFLAPSPSLLKASKSLGHIEVPHHDHAPAVHRIKPYLENFHIHDSAAKGRKYIPDRVPALSLQAALMAMRKENDPVKRLPGFWQIGDYRVPVDRDGYFLIDYQGKPDEVFPTLAYEDLYAASGSPESAAFYKKFFKDKIVLIGDTSKIGNDLLYTPLGTMWGVEAHAHAVSSFLQRASIYEPPAFLNLLTICGLSALICGAARLRRLRPFVLVCVALGMGYFALSVWIFVEHAVALHLVAPMTALVITAVGVLIQRGLSEERDKDVMFDSLVLAAASAIEDRDPSTSGHSQRVTLLTVELNYAGMLHDFGKIGVRESTLTKSHKIEPTHFQTIKARLLLQRQTRQHHAALLKLDAILDIQSKGVKMSEETWKAFHAMDRQLEEEIRELDEDIARLVRANDPLTTYLPDADYKLLCELLDKLEGMNYEDETGVVRPLLMPEEKEALQIRKGSLTVGEYQEVQRHAAMSYNFLRQIPWTEDLRNIPEIAYAHHEKLNGSGYPLGVTADKIPIEARMMTIADIYDALTAADRPYKKAMSPERALDILRSEAKSGALDSDLLELFIAREVYKVTIDQPSVDITLQSTPMTPQLST